MPAKTDRRKVTSNSLIWLHLPSLPCVGWDSPYILAYMCFLFYKEAQTKAKPQLATEVFYLCAPTVCESKKRTNIWRHFC